jgi:NTP pyrophosphatase (non-canonical NTP hydrolase)
MINKSNDQTATNEAGIMMNDYQTAAMRTAMYPSPLMPQADRAWLSVSWVYPALKLAGETGEVSEKLGKILRDQHGVMTEDQRVQLKLELGDVLWYIAALARDLGWTLDEVAVANINKLASRAARGVIQGSGDNR